MNAFRYAAYVSEDDYPDERLKSRIANSIDLIEDATDLKIIRGNYTYEWKRFPKAKRGCADHPLTIVGFHATDGVISTVDKEGVETPYTDYYQGNTTDIGSVLLYPKDKYSWDEPNDYAFVRVKTMAGCDLNMNRLPPKFLEATALAFRFLYNGEKQALDAANMILSRWTQSGSRV